MHIPAMILTLASCACLAHQDTVVQIRKDGTMIGLPKQFQPCALNIEFKKSNSETPVESLVIVLSGHRIQFPPAVLRLLKSKNLKAVFASASWYYEERTLPFYMRVEFLEPGFDVSCPDNPGIAMLFNLRTGKLMDMANILVHREEMSWEERQIDLSSICTKEELVSFYEPLKLKRREK